MGFFYSFSQQQQRQTGTLANTILLIKQLLVYAHFLL